MRKTLFIVTTILFVWGCQKEVINNDADSQRIEALVLKYHLKKIDGTNRNAIKFDNLSSLEEFLDQRVKQVIGAPTPVDKLTEKRLSTEEFASKESISAAGGPPAPKPCHGANMSFSASWNIKKYDASTNMNLQVNYSTNSSQKLTGVSLSANPYGTIPDQFSLTSTQISANGDNIHMTFTTSQTNTVSLGITNYSTTSVTKWTVDLNTCSGLATTSYATAPL